MATLITMNLNEFITDFLKESDLTKYHLIIVSSEISAESKLINPYKGTINHGGLSSTDPGNSHIICKSTYPNVDFVSGLRWNSSEYSLAASSHGSPTNFETYEDMFSSRLLSDFSIPMQEMWAIGSIIAKDDADVILLCGISESQFKPLEIIGSCVQSRFGIPYITYQDYKTLGSPEFDKEKAISLLDEYEELVKNYDPGAIVFNRFISTYHDQMKETLGKKTVEELRDLCKKYSLYVKPTLDKDGVVDFIINHLSKSEGV